MITTELRPPDDSVLNCFIFSIHWIFQVLSWIWTGSTLIHGAQSNWAGAVCIQTFLEHSIIELELRSYFKRVPECEQDRSWSTEQDQTGLNPYLFQTFLEHSMIHGASGKWNSNFSLLIIELGTIFNTVCGVLDLSNPEYSAVIIEKIIHYVVKQANKALIENTEAQK